MTITSKTTKAQLLQYIEELEALASAVNDAIRFERWCANGFQRIVDEVRSLRYN